jgi:hypothetical protein
MRGFFTLVDVHEAHAAGGRGGSLAAGDYVPLSVIELAGAPSDYLQRHH